MFQACIMAIFYEPPLLRFITYNRHTGDGPCHQYLARKMGLRTSTRKYQSPDVLSRDACRAHFAAGMRFHYEPLRSHYRDITYFGITFIYAF